MKKRIAILLIFVLTLLPVAALTSCGQKSDLDTVRSSGKLVIGVTVYDGMDYIKDGEEWVGFDADLAKLFAEELGVTPVFQLIVWKNKVTELKSGNIDLIWNGMTVTEELAADIDFSLSYAENRQVVIARRSDVSAFPDVTSLKNAKVACEAGSAGEKVAKETIGAATVNALANGQVSALLEVTSGQSDVAVVDYTLAASVVGKGDYADLVLLDTAVFSFNKEEFAVGLRQGSDLKALLDDFLRARFADGTMARLNETYGSPVVVSAETLG